ncbi:MAG: hypothetical protein J0H10_15875 [Alphaproteobacteria bacterium]|nr:hypothetical protein [Alphaproteobacteria bacterium]
MATEGQFLSRGTSAYHASGAYTAVTADATANAAVIDTGLSAITAVQVMILRAGKVATSDAAVSVSGGKLTVGDGSTYSVTAADVIHWVAFGN